MKDGISPPRAPAAARSSTGTRHIADEKTNTSPLQQDASKTRHHAMSRMHRHHVGGETASTRYLDRSQAYIFRISGIDGRMGRRSSHGRREILRCRPEEMLYLQHHLQRLQPRTSQASACISHV